jgi:hypothetical protein
MKLLLISSLSPDSVSSLSKSNSKTRTKKTDKVSKTKKRIHCPEGSKINPKTGRCNKIKVILLQLVT